MTQTDRSGNEIYATAYKAGRGAGIPTAQAERMAVVLAGQYSDSVLGAFLTHLATDQNPLSVDMSGGTCTIQNAHMLRDFTVIDDALGAGMDQVILPAMGADALVDALCLVFGWACVSDGAQMIFTKTATPHPNPPKRAMVDDALWDKLNAWAARTYVPETENSLLSGAGAGLNDND